MRRATACKGFTKNILPSYCGERGTEIDNFKREERNAREKERSFRHCT